MRLIGCFSKNTIFIHKTLNLVYSLKKSLIKLKCQINLHTCTVNKITLPRLLQLSEWAHQDQFQHQLQLKMKESVSRIHADVQVCTCSILTFNKPNYKSHYIYICMQLKSCIRLNIKAFKSYNNFPAWCSVPWLPQHCVILTRWCLLVDNTCACDR